MPETEKILEEDAVNSAGDVVLALDSLNSFIGAVEEGDKLDYDELCVEGLLIGRAAIHLHDRKPDTDIEEDIAATTDIDIFTSRRYTDWDELPSQESEHFERNRTNIHYVELDELFEEGPRYDIHLLTELGPQEYNRSRNERMLEEEIEMGGAATILDDNITLHLASLEAQRETIRNSQKDNSSYSIL